MFDLISLPTARFYVCQGYHRCSTRYAGKFRAERQHLYLYVRQELQQPLSSSPPTWYLHQFGFPEWRRFQL